MKKLNTLCFLWLFLANISLAHNGTIKGVVYDAFTRTGLPGANVTIPGSRLATFTDELGSFTFSGLEEGNYRLAVSFIGYAADTLEVTVKDDETSSLRIALHPKEINLPDIQITAESGDNLNVISAIDIQTRPINNSQDILRVVPGLVIAQHAGGGKAEQIFLRGFDNDHGTDIRISVDGIPVNMVSHAHGQGYADLHWLIPEMVREVDFAKGTYEARVGDLATAGYVNFLTPTALNESMIKLEAGQFDTRRSVVALDLLGEQGRAKNQNAWLASEGFFSNSYFDSPQNFTRFNLMGKYSGLIGENQSVTAFFSTFKSSWNQSGQIPLRAVKEGLISRYGAIDDTEGGNTSRTNLSLVFMKNTGKQSFFKNQIYLVKYDFELYSNFTFFLNDPVDGDQIRQKESRSMAGYNGSWNKRSEPGGLRLNSEIGLQLRYDDIADDELSHTKNRRETLERIQLGDVQEINAGFYVDEMLELSPRWKLNAALRYDQFYFSYADALTPAFSQRTRTEGTLSPKLNLFFDAAKTLQFYLNSGVGFHSNDARVVVLENRQTLPKAYSAEAGLFVKPFPSLLLNLAAWRLDLQQEFIYVGDEGVVEPGGKTKRQGIDFSLRWQLARWLYADADLNLAQPRLKGEPTGENFIPLAPTATSIGGFRVQAPTGWFGSLRYRYIAARPANEDNSIVAEGQFIIDAMAGLKKRKYELSLSVQNLLNTEFNDAQFATETRLRNEPFPVEELHFTPGSSFFLKGSVSYFF